PWRGVTRDSYNRVFKLKAGAWSSLEILRFASRRPTGQFIQSMKVGFGAPSPPPAQLIWQEVTRRSLKLHIPCNTSLSGTAAAVQLPLTVRVDQKIEVAPIWLTAQREPLSFRIDVGSVPHLGDRTWSAIASEPWSTVIRASGTPQLSMIHP